MRLLNPHDYGLFAMTQTVLTALNFLNGYAFASSLIQSKEVNERQIGQVFGMLLVSNGLIASTQFLSAPLVGELLRAAGDCRHAAVQALVFLATPFIALPSELLARKLDFRRQALITLAAPPWARQSRCPRLERLWRLGTGLGTDCHLHLPRDRSEPGLGQADPPDLRLPRGAARCWATAQR